MAKKRGFASMDAAKQREIASKGGKAAHQKGTAHQFTTEEARAAGRKGGQVAHFKGTAHKFTSDEARAAGRKGGRSARNNSAVNPELPAVNNTPPPPPPEETAENPTAMNGGSFASHPAPAANGNSLHPPAVTPMASPGLSNMPS
jgi:general stress protein YciG